MIELIYDKIAWNTIIASFEDVDFYHTYEYHQISKNKGDTPTLIKYSENGTIIALPLLVRQIEGTPYKDATSVYGYPGPLITSSSGNSADFDNSFFREKLQAFFRENNYVSVFSRLNPYIPSQEAALVKLPEIVTLGQVINIDLTISLEEQRQQYYKRLRTYINKCRRTYTIRKVTNKAEVDQFIDLYYENMRRVDAKKKYFFEKDYFFRLMESPTFETVILLAAHNVSGMVVAGSMFIKKNNIIQYHLSGVNADCLSLNPIKLLIEEMAIRGREEGYKYFNLGGGVGNLRDSLFDFKAGYSKDFRSFKVWRYIVDETIYDELVSRKNAVNCKVTRKKCMEFFPCYRCESPHTLS